MVKVCRFNGNTKWHYSNLQHCLNVYHITKQKTLKFPALLHDVHEHILGDIITPVSKHFPMWRLELTKLKHRLDEKIAEHFNCPGLVDYDVMSRVKYYDTEMTNCEAHKLMKNAHLVFPFPKVKFEIKRLSNGKVVDEFLNVLNGYGGYN